MSLTLIVGCMFGGKTTELLRMVEREESIKRSVLVINHMADSERSGKYLLKTHSGKERRIDYEFGEFTNKIFDDIKKRNVDTIAINEGQFFHNLSQFVLKFLEQGINVIVCGLDSDYKREPFREITDLIPHANNLIKLYALCIVCKNGTPALYSKRICGGESRIQIGGGDSYIPVCRKCYEWDGVQFDT